jgi:hypothetical protein
VFEPQVGIFPLLARHFFQKIPSYRMKFAPFYPVPARETKPTPRRVFFELNMSSILVIMPRMSFPSHLSPPQGKWWKALISRDISVCG